MSNKLLSEGFNWEIAVNHLIIYQRFIRSKEAYFFRKKESYYRQKGEQSYYWEVIPRLRDRFVEAFGDKFLDESKYEYLNEERDWELKHFNIIYDRPNRYGEEYSKLCCRFQSDLEKNTALENHIDASCCLQESDFTKWLNTKPEYKRAVSIICKKKVATTVPVWEKPYIEYSDGIDIFEIILCACLCKSLLVVNYPDSFGKIIKKRKNLGSNDIEIPEGVQRAALQILKYVENENFRLSQLEIRFLEMFGGGVARERLPRSSTLKECCYLPIRQTQTERRRLYITDLFLQLRRLLYSTKSPTKRPPPELMAELCGIIEYHADPRAIQSIIQSKIEPKISPNSSKSIVDLALRSGETYENIRELF